LKKYAIIVAGGSGTRMNSEVPKQFMELNGKPILVHTIERFLQADKDTHFIIVLPIDAMETWVKMNQQFKFDALPSVFGGDTRFDSVKNGLQLVTEESIVAVHDAVRPLASAELITRCYAEAEKFGNAVPCIPVNDSLRSVKGNKNEIADRNSFVSIQTPQCFHSDILKKAYQTEYKKTFTDDASVVEDAGEKIHLMEGERENIKITFAEDLIFAQAVLKKKYST
jgi:2-C-methyl-D-erythritol 4-phosphate cytidylyltransferase